MSRLLSYDELKPEKGIRYTNSHLWRLEKAGAFPKRISLAGGGRAAWSEDEVDAWIEQQIAERDAKLEEIA